MSVPISLGYRVRDKASGLSGYVIGRIEWITGRVTIIVQPDRAVDKFPVPLQWCDEEQVEVIWSEAWLTPDAN